MHTPKSWSSHAHTPSKGFPCKLLFALILSVTTGCTHPGSNPGFKALAERAARLETQATTLFHEVQDAEFRLQIGQLALQPSPPLDPANEPLRYTRPAIDPELQARLHTLQTLAQYATFLAQLEAGPSANAVHTSLDELTRHLTHARTAHLNDGIATQAGELPAAYRVDAFTRVLDRLAEAVLTPANQKSARQTARQATPAVHSLTTLLAIDIGITNAPDGTPLDGLRAHVHQSVYTHLLRQASPSANRWTELPTKERMEQARSVLLLLRERQTLDAALVTLRDGLLAWDNAHAHLAEPTTAKAVDPDQFLRELDRLASLLSNLLTALQGRPKP